MRKERRQYLSEHPVSDVYQGGI